MRRPRNRCFDLLAPVYDAALRGFGLSPVLEALAPSAGLLVLDLGGGTGRLAGRLTHAGACPVVLDASGPMLRRAVHKSLPAVRGRAERLPLRDASVERVAIVDALHHMADLGRVAAEVARVLRPGGSAVILEPDPERFAGRWVARLETWAGMRSLLLPADELAQLFSASGLVTTVERIPFHLLVRARKPLEPDQR